MFKRKYNQQGGCPALEYADNDNKIFTDGVAVVFGDGRTVTKPAAGVVPTHIVCGNFINNNAPIQLEPISTDGVYATEKTSGLSAVAVGKTYQVATSGETITTTEGDGFLVTNIVDNTIYGKFTIKTPKA